MMSGTKKYMQRQAGVAIVFLLIVSAGAPAFGGTEAPNGILSIIFENDVFYNTDCDYTNGAALVWVPTKDAPPDWALRVAHWIPWFPEDGILSHGYAIGQNMYTPRNITLADPRRDDRPYAGWLYGAIGVGAETGQQLDQFVLTAGVIGPASHAEQTQKLVHRTIDTDIPRGWDTQLRNEPGLNIMYERSWRKLAAKTFDGHAFDLTPHLGGALGNVYTYANTGLTLRFGESLPLDYGPPRIQPSTPGSYHFIPVDKFTWYLFAGVDGRAVARNIFLDGNTFEHSRSVKKEPFVADAQWGFVLTWRNYRLGLTHVVRTREFKGGNGSDKFGSINLSMGL